MMRSPDGRPLRRTPTVVAVLVVFALMATACGSSSRGSASGDAGSEGTSGPSATEATADDVVMFGDLESPCGPGDAAANAAAPTAQGVDGSTVTIGYGDDAGFRDSPGLNHEMSDAVRAMMEWCNEQGGINGRTVQGNYYDGKITEANNAMVEACQQVFMMVGQGFALDNASEQTRVTCGLPSVAGFATNPEVATGPELFTPSPSVPDMLNIQMGYALAEAFPEAVKHVAIVYSELPTIVSAVDRSRAAYPEAGWEFIGCDQTYPLTGGTAWLPIVQRLKDCGAQVVYFVGAPAPNFENFLDAANQADFHPIYAEERNFYEASFAEWNQNGNADDVYVSMQAVPFELADQVPATQDYLQIVGDAGGDVSLLGALATSAFLLWAQAADECGAELSRECVVANLETITEWDGGGLQAPANPGDNIPSDCSVVMRMQGTTYVPWSPAEGSDEVFNCDPKYLVTVQTEAVANAQLDEDRRSTLFTSG